MLPGYHIAQGVRRMLPLALLALASAGPALASNIELYAGRSSVPAGGAIAFHVSTDLPDYDLRVYRFGAQVELVEPVGDDSPVSRFLQKGGGLHHLCYEVENLAEHLKIRREAGCIVVRPPMPAAAFDNRLIAWALTRQKLLLEFLEAERINS